MHYKHNKNYVLRAVSFEYVVKIFFDHVQFFVGNLFLVEKVFALDEEVFDVLVVETLHRSL